MNRHLREQILAEWRGLPQKPPRADRTVSAADAVLKVMQSLGLNERLREAQVLQCWKDIVGEFIAEHSCPSRLRDGILFVQVVQPTVHYELDRIWKPQILKKLKARFGARVIREIRFRTGG
jgi:predicted nucleic acid-binding Zn ribbon protein